jgi:hypothetical protein
MDILGSTMDILRGGLGTDYCMAPGTTRLAGHGARGVSYKTRTSTQTKRLAMYEHM